MATFHLFAYGTLRRGATAHDILAGATHVRAATIGGTLYDIDGEYPALILYGRTPVPGDIWRCPADLLKRLDAYERVDDGLFRRVGLLAADIPCWTYVAGPALASRLTPDRLMPHGDWLARLAPNGTGS